MMAHPGCGQPEHPDDLASRPLPQQVALTFHHTMLAHRQLIGRKLGLAGLHPGQAMCLREIAHSDGITQRDLAERLNVARPTVTVMLQKMERAGLVERRADEHDQRFTRLHLTEAAKDIHQHMHTAMGEIADDIVGDMSEEDQVTLMALLGRLSENIHAAMADMPEEGTHR